MKILFINAINPYAGIENRYPPLGLGYLASSLRKHFGQNYFEFKIIDRNIEKELEKFKPDLVGITSVSQNYQRAKSYARLAKTKGLPVIMGGIHISMLPSSLSKDMDIGVIGEGEITIVELLETFLNKKQFIGANLRNIPGVIFWENQKLFQTERRSLITPLDLIPFPARDLLKIEKNTYIFTSRGCPYRCVFCASSRYWNKVRYFSAEYVVKEIDELVNKYQAEVINFYDDLMMADKNRLKNIVALIKQKPYNGRIKFTANARANVLNEEIVGLLKEINVISVGMGLESGSKRMLNYLKGSSVTVEDGLKAIKLLKQHKISPNASFVIGSPDETESEIMETLSFIRKSKLDIADIYVLTPFPGTPIWDHAKERGLVSDNMDWESLNVSFNDNYEKAIILSQNIGRKKLHYLYMRFRYWNYYLVFRKIISNPKLLIRGIVRLLNKIKSVINYENTIFKSPL